MKTFDISKAELTEFFSRQPGRESTDRVVSKALYTALTKYGAQAEYITQLANVWITANEAEAKAKTQIEQALFRSAMENASRYVADLLRQCGNQIDGCDELALYRVLELAWEHFRKRK